MIDVPRGFRIERVETLDDGLFDPGREGLVREVRFTALATLPGGAGDDVPGPTEEVVAEPSVRYARRERRYVLHPGFTSSNLTPDMARARAAALLMAADEADRLTA